MPGKTKTSKVNRLLRESADIAWLSPSIASWRLMKLSSQTPWTAAFNLSTMGAEKAAAFTTACIAMTTVAARAQTQWMLQAFTGMWRPGALVLQRRTAGKRALDASLDMLASGVRPVHRRVVGNASRR